MKILDTSFIKFVEPNKENITYIYKKLRKYDKMECDAVGIKKAEDLLCLQESYVATLDGEPVVYFGYNILSCAIHFTCLGTEIMNKYPAKLTRVSKNFIDIRMKMFFPRQAIVPVHKDNSMAIGWLNYLNFNDSGWKYKGLNIFIRKINSISKREKICAHQQ